MSHLLGSGYANCPNTVVSRALAGTVSLVSFALCLHCLVAIQSADLSHIRLLSSDVCVVPQRLPHSIASLLNLVPLPLLISPC